MSLLMLDYDWDICRICSFYLEMYELRLLAT